MALHVYLILLTYLDSNFFSKDLIPVSNFIPYCFSLITYQEILYRLDFNFVSLCEAPCFTVKW
jgi:hypothetical protein